MRIVTLVGLVLFSGLLPCLSESIPESELKKMIDRVAISWQERRAADAFNTLDSIISQPTTKLNASFKAEAALLKSSYLLEFKKIFPAKALIDSALNWSEQFQETEKKIRAYQTLCKWQIAVGNWPAAFRAKENEWQFRDSLTRFNHAVEIDSMKKALDLSESNLKTMKESAEVDSERGVWRAFALPSGFGWILILGLILIAVLIRFRTGNQKPHQITTIPSSYGSVTNPSPYPTTGTSPGNVSPVFDFNSRKEQTHSDSEAPEGETEPRLPPNKDTLLRLQGVELVLIRAEVLAAYQNGELKAIRNLLNEYMAQLPFIMKTLDDAINRNETAPILISLQHVKSYLKLFGMQATEKLIWEVESESSTEKVSKLLSRVFQVRNHCRRAADEAKSLLEKIG